jgi:hypothetical protein
VQAAAVVKEHEAVCAHLKTVLQVLLLQAHDEFLTYLKPEFRLLAAAVVHLHLQQQWQWLTAAAAVSVLMIPRLQILWSFHPYPALVRQAPCCCELEVHYSTCAACWGAFRLLHRLPLLQVRQ